MLRLFETPLANRPNIALNTNHPDQLGWFVKKMSRISEEIRLMGSQNGIALSAIACRGDELPSGLRFLFAALAVAVREQSPAREQSQRAWAEPSVLPIE